jgi:hypothetical protein
MTSVAASNGGSQSGTTLELSRTCFLCPRCLLHGFPHRSLKKQPIDGTFWTDVQPRAHRMSRPASRSRTPPGH